MARRRAARSAGSEIYLEYVVIGQSVKVSAVDAATGTEVSITGPASASQSELQRVAVQKLKRALGQSAGMR